MKFKKISIFGTLFFVFFFSSVFSANAGEWFVCEVISTGPMKVSSSDSTAWVKLTDTASTPAFTSRWFQLAPACQKEMLAVALTAITNENVVSVQLPDTTQYQTCTSLYLRNQKVQ